MSDDSKQDIVYIYPKTSCPCAYCKKEYDVPKGHKTNLSVRGCKVSPYFECHNRVELDTGKMPEHKHGWYELNPQVYNDQLDPLFNKVICNDGYCPKVTYVSPDPRGFNAVRAQYTRLDRPPINGDVRLKDVNKKKWNGYGQGFTPYSMIKDGQIVYYIDKSIEDPFFGPNFATPAEETAVLYKDPMGAMKPEYTRYPVVNTENPAITTAEYYPDCLSWIQDSQTHREDLLSFQMRKRNQERWEPRWTLPEK